MLKELIKLANHLDSKGLTKEADYIDKIIKMSSNSEDDIRSKFESELRKYIDPYEKSSLNFDEDLKERHGIFDSNDNLKVLIDVATRLRDKFQRQIDNSSSFFGAIDDFEVDYETLGYVMKLEDVIKDANNSIVNRN